MAPRNHIAILKKPYIDLILRGDKPVECRLTKTRRAPFGLITPGDLIAMKQSAGPFRARATAQRVLMEHDLTPEKIDALRDTYNHLIRGDDEYWLAKRTARYATLIWLTDIQPADHGPDGPASHGLAWFALEPATAPNTDNHTYTVTLTDGALRNGYLPLPHQRIDHIDPAAYGGPNAHNAGRKLHVTLQQHRTIQSDIVEHAHRLRHRGFASWYAAAGLKAGDQLRIVVTSPTKLRVEPITNQP